MRKLLGILACLVVAGALLGVSGVSGVGVATAQTAQMAQTSQAFQSPGDAVGKPFPPLSVEFLGPQPTLEGKARVVEFWATWCPPCRASIPHLNELNKKFKEKGLVVVGVTNESKATVENFRAKIPMEYNVALDSNGALSKQLGIRGIPHAFVLGKNGTVIWQGHPMELKEATLEKALSE